VGFSLCNNV